MNTRRLFREYAKYKGKEAVEFVELEREFPDYTCIVTKNSKGYLEKTNLGVSDWEEMVYFIQRTYLKDIKLED